MDEMNLTKRQFSPCGTPGGLSMAMAAVGGAFFVLYGLTLSRGMYPGVSSEWVAAALGLNPWHSAAHPLWRLCAVFWSRIPLGSHVGWLNVSSAVYGAGAAALLCQFVARWVYSRIKPAAAEDDGKKLSLVSIASGVVASVFLGTSLAGWSAATRFQPGTFDLLLVLLAFSLYQNYLLSHKLRNLHALALLCGLGACESAQFLVLEPFFIGSVIAVLYWHHRLRLRLCSGLMAMGLLGASSYVLSSWQFAHVAGLSWGVPMDWAQALRQVIKSQITDVARDLPMPGWPFILLMVVLPWLAFQLGFWDRLLLKRNFRADAIHLFLVIIVFMTQFNAPIPPWPQWVRAGWLPVLEAAFLAMLGGWVCAYWLCGWPSTWGLWSTNRPRG